MVATLLAATQQLSIIPSPTFSIKIQLTQTLLRQNTETYLESNVGTPSNIPQKSSPECTIDISPSNRINETFLPSNIHTPVLASVPNDNSSLTPKNILKMEAQLSVLKSYIDCKLAPLTSKIVVFSDSVKNVLSDLQNKEHENSQIEVLKKNVTLLQNEIKSKDTIIESLFETQKTLTK